MNLLEHYILEVKKEEKIQDPKTKNKYYKVKAIIDCYGVKEIIDRLFSIDEWEDAKRKGFYMA